MNRKRTLEESVKEYIPSYFSAQEKGMSDQKIHLVGFTGTEQDYQDLVEYAKKVYQATLPLEPNGKYE
jgi:hypothetical protein